MHVVEEKPLDEKLPSVVTNAERDTLAKDTKSKKGIIGSQPRSNHSVFTHYPEDPNCEVCKETNTTRARCGIKPKKRVDGIAPSTKCGDLNTADHKNSERGKRVEMRIQKRFNRARWYHELDSELSEKNERNIGDNVVFTKISSSVTDNWKVKACQDWQWNHYTSTPHRSETNGVAERAVPRVNDGTAIAPVQSGLSEEFWLGLCDGMIVLLAQRARQKRQHSRFFLYIYGQTFDGPSTPFETLVDYVPITAKDKSRIHQYGQTTLKGIFFGYVPRAGGGWSGDLMIADYEDLHRIRSLRNLRETIFKKKKNKKYSEKKMTNFRLQPELWRLLGRPRPSSTAEGNFEREDNVEIEESDTMGS